MAFNLGDVLKSVSNSDTGREQITYLPIDNLDSDAGNFYELRDIDALADNISVAGLQQPIRVRAGQEPGRYTIVSGHRRLAACRKLAEENPEAWREVPCIIETDSASPALQQLRLIYANANTRQLTSAEMSEQAQQVEKLLYELKNEGYDFPGRMRDHVAEAVGASKTKLARLKVIRDKLIPEWTMLWKDNKLPESTAYVLAQADPEYQRRVLDNEVRVYGGYDFPIPGLPTVENRLKEMAKADKLVSGLGCPIRPETKCLHRAPRLQRAAHCGTYDALCCAGCCRKCSNLAYCTFSCELAGDLKKERRGKITAENAAKKAAEKAAEKDRVAAAKALLTKCYGRVRALREERNIPRTVFLKASTGYMFKRDSERLEKLEQGQAMGSDRMPGGIWADEAQRLVATADLLGCSVDYLLGRDAPEVTAPAGIWHTEDPKRTGDYIVIYDFDRDSKALIDKMHWDKYDRSWTIFHASLPEGVTVHFWTEVPEVTDDV